MSQRVNPTGARLRLLPSEPDLPFVAEPQVVVVQPRVKPTVRGIEVTRLRLLSCVLIGFLAYAAGQEIWLHLLTTGADVSVARVQRGTISERVPTVALGRVTAERELTVRSEFSARVGTINYRVGERVRAGTPLLELEVSDLKNSVGSAERALATARSLAGEAQIRAELSQRKEARALPLAAAGVLSAADAETLTLERRIASRANQTLRARALEQEGNLSTALRNLSRAELRAPFDAIVLSVPIEQGQAVLPGTALMQLADDRALHVSANIDEADLGAVRTGMPVELSFEAFDEPPLRRKLSQIEPSVLAGEHGGRVVTIRIDLSDTSRLRVGMGVHVDVLVAERKDAVLSPISALIGSGPTRSAFLVVNGEARRRKLQVGISNWESVEVVRGLAPGDVLLLNPEALKVQDGQRVRALAPTAGKSGVLQ